MRNAVLLVGICAASGCVDADQSVHDQVGNGDPEIEPDADLGRPDAGDPVTRWVEETLDSMSDEAKVGQLLIVRHFGSCDEGWLQDLLPGGVVYYGDEVSNVAALRADNLEILACARDVGLVVPPLTTANHDGGRINYFEPGTMTDVPSAMQQCYVGPDWVGEVSTMQAVELAYAGITMTLGPTADVLLDRDNQVIGDRAYATSAQRAAECVASATAGYRAAGVDSIVKHFPGHGGTAADTHIGLATDPALLGDLQATHLPPFWAALDQGARYVMMGHVVYDNVDARWPASLSPTILGLLREREGGFDGVAMTADLGMGAITGQWAVDLAALRALMVGNDMLMLGTIEDARAARDLVLQAMAGGFTGTLADLSGGSEALDLTAAQVRERVDESVRRILRAKALLDVYDHAEVIARIDSAAVPNWNEHASRLQEPRTCQMSVGGNIVDEASRCVRFYGNPEYWHTAPAGYDGRLRWTYATATAMDNYASWPMHFDAAGRYRVCARRTPGFFESRRAPYTVVHAGQASMVLVDQRGADVWLDLGVFEFAAGGEQMVRLADSTGESVSLRRVLGFDAIALVPEARSCDDGPL